MPCYDARHAAGLDHLRAATWLISVEDVLETIVEQPITESGMDVTDIDLLMRTPSGLVVLEYKSGDDARNAKKRRDDAVNQLTRIGNVFADRLGFRPRSVYAHGQRFVSEVIDEGSRHTPSFDLEYVVDVLDPLPRPRKPRYVLARAKSVYGVSAYSSGHA